MRCVLLIILVAGLSSCATVFNHPAQPVSVTPEFQGAARTERVRVLITSGRGTYQAALPTQFVVTPDFATHATVTVVEPCFQQTVQPLPRHLTGWLIGDLLAAAADPLVILMPAGGDVLDGTMWSYSKEARVKAQPVPDFEACLAESRKNPGFPFPVTQDPVWVDARHMGKP